MPSPELAASERAQLAEIAAAGVLAAIEERLVDVPDTLRAGALAAPGASFVTLEREGVLRGCIGSVTPRRPLVDDVAGNAFAAAALDRRFPRLERWELAALAIEVSILSPLEELAVGSEEELVARLRPGIDGLVIEAGARRATFLPAVWEQLAEPARFVRALRTKAGLDRRTWSPAFRCRRYTVASFPADPPASES
jgi:uncharacterized protein